MKILPRSFIGASSPAKEIDTPAIIRRSVEITVEREFLSISAPSGASFTALCPRCGIDVLMLDAGLAALSTHTSPREIYRAIDSGVLHFQELPTGTVFLCSESLKSLQPSPPDRPSQLSSGDPQ